MTVTTFTIDGIIKPDGAPVILEYNRGMNSGSSGYHSFTGRKMIDRIMRDLKEKAGFDHIWFDDMECEIAQVHFRRSMVPSRHMPYHMIIMPDYELSLKDELHEAGKRHLVYPGATIAYIDKYSGDYCSTAPSIKYAAIEKMRQDLQYLTETGAHVEIADYPAVFDIFYRNKTHISRLLQKGVLDPAFYPRQNHYSGVQRTKDLAASIAADFKGASRIMIKHATLARGEGIISISDPNYKKVIDAIRLIKEEDPRRGIYNQGPRLELDLVAQEFIEGRSLSVRQSFMEAAGFLRSPKQAWKTLENYSEGDDSPRHYAFRLFISYANGELILHDGWLKFSDYAADEPEHDKFISGRMYAGPLSTSRKRQIFKALELNMTELFCYLETHADEFSYGASDKEPDMAPA